jgi:hypothetical protein
MKMTWNVLEDGEELEGNNISDEEVATNILLHGFPYENGVEALKMGNKKDLLERPKVRDQ